MGDVLDNLSPAAVALVYDVKNAEGKDLRPS